LFGYSNMLIKIKINPSIIFPINLPANIFLLVKVKQLVERIWFVLSFLFIDHSKLLNVHRGSSFFVWMEMVLTKYMTQGRELCLFSFFYFNLSYYYYSLDTDYSLNHLLY